MSNEDLAALLLSRGLVADLDKLLRVLAAVGYYRLSGYLVPFKDKGTDNFIKGTTLDDVWNIYTLDRNLRLTAMDALARIEVAVRALVTRHHTDYNADPFAYVDPKNLPKISPARHTDLLRHIENAVSNARQEPFIKHLAIAHGITQYPPIWTMMEIIPMGTLTYYYEGLPDPVQQKIANTFHVRPSVFGGWLMVLKKIRNVCAHQGRLWNKPLAVASTRKIGSASELDPLRQCLDAQVQNGHTNTFSALSLCAYCLNVIRPESNWIERCKTLVKASTPFARTGMGFPIDWEKYTLWAANDASGNAANANP